MDAWKEIRPRSRVASQKPEQRKTAAAATMQGPSERTSKRAHRRKDWDGGKEGDWGVGSWVLSVGDAHVPPPEASRWSPWHPPIGSLGSRFRPRRRRNPP